MTKKNDYLTPLDVPEGASGGHFVEHFRVPAGEALHTANFRCRMFGQRGETVRWPHETRWHRMGYEGGTWMTDLPCEQAQHRECLKNVRGDVLIGGLGLGLAVSILRRKKGVRKITVVEVSEGVIELVGPHTRGCEVVHANLFDYLRNYKGRPFSSAFYDVWQSDGEGTFFGTVCPLIALSEGKVKKEPACWNRGVMAGQLAMSLWGRLITISPEVREQLGLRGGEAEPKAEPWEEAGDVWLDWQVKFWRWWKNTRPQGDKFSEAASLYCNLYGSWGWEAKWESLSKFLA